LVVSCTTADFGPDVGISCTTRYSIWGARHDLMMEAFGGKGFCVEDPKHLRGALDEAMNFRRPALVNVKLSLGSQRKAQEFRWHS